MLLRLMLTALTLVAASLRCSAEDRETPPAHTASYDNTYRLGAGDQVSISALELEEISRSAYRVDNAGFISVPLIGRVKAAGLTVTQLESDITTRLTKFQMRPQVTVGIQEFQSQPVSVIGAVTTPGVHHLQGNKTLIEALSAAGGLRPDAGNTVKITRMLAYGKIPLANATNDSTGQFSVAEVKIRNMMEASNPSDNILVKPHDTISVPRAKMVYVIGEVPKSGGFPVTEQESFSVLQALSLAGGLERLAAPKNAKVLRFRPGAAERVEEAINLKRIMNGRDKDVPLRPEDILFVPSNKGKAIALRVIEAAVNTGSGVAVWRSAR